MVWNEGDVGMAPLYWYRFGMALTDLSCRKIQPISKLKKLSDMGGLQALGFIRF